ncbi:MAG: hypothetical protein Q3M24_15140 [Candidatus Electrothrix aestuarii]|uniref:Uncharacterized protein n=1 Tax=Candidatus Electrothrix aestuarii TaxID=3062594 RepID=A0AAU8LS36_9BACT
MSGLEFHVQRLITWVSTLEGCPASWSDVRIVDDSLQPLCNEKRLWEISRNSLMSIEQYEERFSELLAKGYHWLNLNFAGVYQDSAILFIECPANSANIPKEKVSVNLSGPAGNEWDLSKRLIII